LSLNSWDDDERLERREDHAVDSVTTEIVEEAAFAACAERRSAS
jgi:hypothetical protein